jgi:protein-S-isoprenylcysteine O-methyltransferase Ste14
MPKSAAILGSALFFLIAPVMVGFVAPWWIAGWHMGPPLFGNNLFRLTGVAFVIAGLVPLIESFARFALVGLGTPAPVAPTQHLVVTGFYRYVRNPMYLGVVAIVYGNGLILHAIDVNAYMLIVMFGFIFFVQFYEEPTLRRRFGAEYERYCANVRPWIPRLTPWMPTTRE